MLKKTILKLSYIRKVLTGFISRSKEPQVKESPSAKYYRSIDEMPLRVFINILCEDNIQYLITSGNIPDEILQPIWDKILEQYLDATFSDEDRHLISLMASESLLDYNITKAKAIQRYLFYRHDDEMIALLVKMGAADGPYPDQGTDVAKAAWKKRVTAKIKKWQHTLKELSDEIRRLQPNDSEDVAKISRAYFDDMLSKLSQYFHYHVDENTVMVSRYLSMYKDYKQHLLTLRKQAKPV